MTAVSIRPKDAKKQGVTVEYVCDRTTYGPWPERFGTPRGGSRSRRLRFSDNISDFTDVIYRYPRRMEQKSL